MEIKEEKIIKEILDYVSKFRVRRTLKDWLPVEGYKNYTFGFTFDYTNEKSGDL
ncbi:hypothetical protein [Dethiothermospora halolimnae]|uniref:hypothetical protein n=1 Tax=Dethiothermospora halolimnae TaxID=3114390 RepID=UPI003CCBAF27